MTSRHSGTRWETCSWVVGAVIVDCGSDLGVGGQEEVSGRDLTRGTVPAGRSGL